MAVLGGIWRVVVGIKDLLVLLLLLLFFVLLWAALSTRAPLSVPGGAALVLDLDGPIVDQASERGFGDFLTGADSLPQEIQVRDVIRSIDTARDDARIKALVLELDTFVGAGQANLQSIGAALKRFKTSGKPVHAYATGYTDGSYYLAAAADKVWVNPLGGVLVGGPGGTGLYFKDALAKLDVDIEVFRVGTYKSAVEPFTRADASPEAEAAEQALVDDLWAGYVRDVRAARPKADLNAVLANLPARVTAARGDFAKAAADGGLVDTIGTRPAFAAAMRELVGTSDGDAPYNGIGFRRYAAANAPGAGGGDAIGIVYVAGTIVDGEAPRGTAGGDTISAAVESALANDSIKALVIRVDSPGGSVLASERIREALAQAKDRKLPIVASLGPVAASGGYWVATAADEIIAEPSTITGSIGVFAVIPTFARALTELGIGTDGVKSTPYSGDPDVLKGLTPETRVLLQASVEDIYRRFTGLVARARKLPQGTVDSIGQGRVWTGTQAKANGLIDGFGGLDAAVAAAARRAGLPADTRTVDIEKPVFLPFELLGEAFRPTRSDEAARDPFARMLAASRLRVLSSLGEAKAVASGPVLQAYCLACAAQTPPRGARVAEAKGWLAMADRLMR